jgi:hypothetical protein
MASVILGRRLCGCSADLKAHASADLPPSFTK